MKTKRIIWGLLSALVLMASGFGALAVTEIYGEAASAPPDQPAAPFESYEPMPTSSPIADELTEPNEPLIAPNPDEPAGFYTKMIWSGGSPTLFGFFTPPSSDIELIQPCYSFDGTDYQPVHQDHSWSTDSLIAGEITKQVIAYEKMSPMMEYLAKEKDAFYIRLHYVIGGVSYFSQAAKTERATQAESLPSDMTVLTRYASSMKENAQGFTPKYSYNVTATAGATAEQVRAMLPSALPVEIQLMDSAKNLVYRTFADCPVEWNLPHSVPPEGIVLANAVKSLSAPADFLLETFYNLYDIGDMPMNFVPLDLRINAVPVGAKPELALHTDSINPTRHEPLYMDFLLKPTGASAIVPYYSVDGGTNWTAGRNILENNEPIEAWQKNAYYNFALLLTPDQSPYKEYLAKQIDGFTVRLDITGGVFHGTSTALPLPMEYVYEPPDKDNSGDGSGGNENNAGSSGADSSSSGGLHPGIPGGYNPSPAPPQQTPPPFLANPPVVGLRPDEVPSADTVDSGDELMLESDAPAEDSAKGEREQTEPSQPKPDSTPQQSGQATDKAHDGDGARQDEAAQSAFGALNTPAEGPYGDGNIANDAVSPDIEVQKDPYRASAHPSEIETVDVLEEDSSDLYTRSQESDGISASSIAMLLLGGAMAAGGVAIVTPAADTFSKMATAIKFFFTRQ